MPSNSCMKNPPSGDPLRYLDASIPLCVATKQPAEKLEGCREIMDAVSRGKERVRTTTFTIAEIIHILMEREREHPARVRESIRVFLDCAGLRVGDARKDLCLPALELALKRKVDFIDAHHRLTMKLHRINEIYSLDRHFDRFPDIKRLEAPSAKP